MPNKMYTNVWRKFLGPKNNIYLFNRTNNLLNSYPQQIDSQLFVSNNKTMFFGFFFIFYLALTKRKTMMQKKRRICHIIISTSILIAIQYSKCVKSNIETSCLHVQATTAVRNLNKAICKYIIKENSVLVQNTKIVSSITTLVQKYQSIEKCKHPCVSSNIWNV